MFSEGPRHVTCASWAQGRAGLHSPSCPLTPFALGDFGDRAELESCPEEEMPGLWSSLGNPVQNPSRDPHRAPGQNRREWLRPLPAPLSQQCLHLHANGSHAFRQAVFTLGIQLSRWGSCSQEPQGTSPATSESSGTRGSPHC